MVGTVVEYRESQHPWGEPLRTMVVTTKGQFIVDGVRSGMTGKIVFVAEYSNGNKYIEIDGSEIKSLVHGY